MNLEKSKIGFIGAGAMAEALLAGIVKSGLIPSNNLFVSDINLERLEYLEQELEVNAIKDNLELVKKAEIIFLAVKPAIISKVIREIGTSLKNKHLVVSIAAGITTEKIEKGFFNPISVLRVMPNTPSLVGAGVSAIALGKNANEKQRDLVGKILETIGQVVFISEDLMDSVTGLSGSGPAYMYMVLEALIDGGVKMGLPRPVARTLAAQTMLGSAKMVLERDEHPAQLKDMVTTPGGTTIAGIHALEEGNLRATLINAVEASAKRAKEMAEA